jgi:hypothetical protein
MTGILHEYQYTFWSSLARFFLEWKVLRTKLCRKSKHTFCVRKIIFENRACYVIPRENMIEADRPRMTVWHIRIAFRIPKPTNTHSEYATLIAFPLQQWLCERASMLTLYVRWLVLCKQWPCHGTVTHTCVPTKWKFHSFGLYCWIKRAMRT